MKGRHISRGLFVTISILCVAIVFGIARLLEGVLFDNASFETLKTLYFLRGTGASFLVMTLAFLFLGYEHRRSEERLRKLSRAVEQSPSTVMITDGAGNIEYVNPRFTQLTGYTRDESIGKNPRILQSGQTPRETYRNLWETVTSGREWRGEFLNKKKNGELYWESTSISALTDSKGTVTHYVGVLEDITARKNLDELKDGLIGNVSHQLRTPLAVIKWSVGNLRDGLAGPLKKEQQELVESINRHSARLERMINEVLDLSRLESGKARINSRSLQLSPLIHEVTQNFRGAAQKRDVTLSVNLPSGLPDVSGDPDMLDQVLGNLLENAIRHARKKVTVTAEAAEKEEEAVQVSVIDDGLGIASEDLGRLFSKFEQINRPEGRGDYKGTGLGLPIAKEIVKQHQGRIWAESEIGKGASFHFTLPITRDGNYGKNEEENSHH